MKAEAKLEALIKRQGVIKAALQVEREKQRAAAHREQERLAAVVGRAVIAQAQLSTEFNELIRGVLRTSALPVNEQKFLKAQGLL